MLTQVGRDDNESKLLRRIRVWRVDHEKEHDNYCSRANQKVEVKEEREHLTECVVCCGVGGDNVANTECHKGSTQVDQEHTSFIETQAAWVWEIAIILVVMHRLGILIFYFISLSQLTTC